MLWHANWMWSLTGRTLLRRLQVDLGQPWQLHRSERSLLRSARLQHQRLARKRLLSKSASLSKSNAKSTTASAAKASKQDVKRSAKLPKPALITSAPWPRRRLGWGVNAMR